VIELCRRFRIDRVRLPLEGWLWRGQQRLQVRRVAERCVLNACCVLARQKFRQAGLIFPDHFFGMLAGGRLSEAALADILRRLPEGSTVIMTHPGSSEQILGRKFAWCYHWQEELAALVSARCKALAAEREVTFINFGGLT
jgi:predicted glycoside hydrolase/deacetylase ChbG (UPF0249 family)